MAAKAPGSASVSSPPPPPEKPAFDPWELLEMNLSAMREYYRSLPGEGPEKGHYVTMELAHGDFMMAVRLARQGKPYTPPPR